MAKKYRRPTRHEVELALTNTTLRTALQSVERTLYAERDDRKKDLARMREDAEMRKLEMTAKVINSMGQTVDAFARIVQDIQNGRHR